MPPNPKIHALLTTATRSANEHAHAAARRAAREAWSREIVATLRSAQQEADEAWSRHLDTRPDDTDDEDPAPLPPPPEQARAKALLARIKPNGGTGTGRAGGLTNAGRIALKTRPNELSTNLRGGGAVLQFPYMGTKHALAPIVADLAKMRPTGPFLDVFAGMCSVARHLQAERNVWTNDLQCFAVTAAKSMLCDRRIRDVELDRFDVRYREHFDRLSNRFRAALREERLLLVALSAKDFTHRFQLLESHLDRRATRHFDLFSAIYANTYIGLEQAIELDSLIYSLTIAVQQKEVDEAIRRTFLFALGRTLLRVSTTTGHFAQFQTPSERNWKRFQRTRRISVRDVFQSDYNTALNVNTRNPEGNRAFNLDAISLLRALRHVERKPSIVYADPPYKQDQYSRYYHLLETLILYDYPKTTGKARYRAGRPSSIFSSKARSRHGIEALAALTSSAGADFILSYPEDGIADVRRDEMVDILAKHFRKVDVVHEGLLRHSTMGASKGSAKQHVIERIYLGRN